MKKVQISPQLVIIIAYYKDCCLNRSSTYSIVNVTKCTYWIFELEEKEKWLQQEWNWKRFKKNLES